ncbi:MAG: RICIN domain-containing protein [Oligoflexus sp.]
MKTTNRFFVMALSLLLSSSAFAVIQNGIYRLQQVETGRYLDAFETKATDYNAVTRQFRNSDSQLWEIYRFNPFDKVYVIKQLSTGRFLEFYSSPDENYSAMTRPGPATFKHRWEFIRTSAVKNSFRIRNVHSRDFLDAYIFSRQGFDAIGSLGQSDSTQDWILIQQPNSRPGKAEPSVGNSKPGKPSSPFKPKIKFPLQKFTPGS